MKKNNQRFIQNWIERADSAFDQDMFYQRSESHYEDQSSIYTSNMARGDQAMKYEQSLMSDHSESFPMNGY